jgi:hypothetical protein
MAKINLTAWWAKITRREPSNLAQASALQNEVYDAQIRQPMGMSVGVPEGSTVLALKVGAGRSTSILLPFANRTLIEVDHGAITVYATSKAGDSVLGKLELANDGNVALTSSTASGSEAGRLELTADGKLAIATQTDDLMAILGELMGMLPTLKTQGSPALHTPDPKWIADLAVLEQRLKSITKT